MLIFLRWQDDVASANVGKQKPEVNCCFWTNYCCLGGCCSAITDRNRESLLHLCAARQLPILSEADRNRCYSRIIAVTPASRRRQKAGSDNGLISSTATSRYKQHENECHKIQIPFWHTSDCPVTEPMTPPAQPLHSLESWDSWVRCVVLIMYVFCWVCFFSCWNKSLRQGKGHILLEVKNKENSCHCCF